MEFNLINDHAKMNTWDDILMNNALDDIMNKQSQQNERISNVRWHQTNL